MEDLMTLNEKTLNEKQIAYTLFSTLKGLQYLHANGIIHRDIKAFYL